MRQSLGLIALILFVAGLSFVLSAQDQQGARPTNTTLTGAAAAPGPAGGEAHDSAKPLTEGMRTPSAEKNNGHRPQRRVPKGAVRNNPRKSAAKFSDPNTSAPPSS